MSFEIRKMSNHGTQHPVVARLKVQTHELIQWADIPKERQPDVPEIFLAWPTGSSAATKYMTVSPARSKRQSRKFVPALFPGQFVLHLIGLRGEVETFLAE